MKPTTHPTRTAFAALGWAALAIATFAPAEAAIFTVGSDLACTHTSLFDALSAASSNGSSLDIIRLANNQTYVGPYEVLAHSVLIRGGYDTCADPTASGHTTVTREFDSRAFEIFGVGPSVSVDLENLDIRYDGSITASVTLGGMIYVVGGASVRLVDSIVSGGRAETGGGIFVRGSSLTVGFGSVVVSNRATFEGGGIGCDQGGLVYIDDGLVIANEATDGAGLALTGGCSATSTAGGPYGIIANIASGNGGGAYLTGASDLDLIGTGSDPARMEDNQAINGAGIFVTGGSDVIARDAWIQRNIASSSGGGVYVEQQSHFDMRRGATTCGSTRCSRLSDNDAAASLSGAALYLDQATATVQRTFVERNDGIFGGVAVIDRGSFLRLQGVLIAQNEGNEMVWVGDDGRLEAGFITVTLNRSPGSDPNVQTSFFTNVGLPSLVEIFSSVIWEPELNGPVWGGGSPDGTKTFDCLLVNTLIGIEDATASRVGNPQFVDPDQGDYHLRPTSPAIDSCDAFYYGPTTTDIDGDLRGQEAAAPNYFGPYDLGFDESIVIFADGFGSGDTSAWSSTSP